MTVKSGDMVEILTSSTQSPRLDWLNYVVTSKARNKIKQAVNEARTKKADMAREMIQRRFKNRKIELDDAMMAKLITRKGYKNTIDFFVDVQEEKIDVASVLEDYVAITQHIADANSGKLVSHETAQNFVLQQHREAEETASDDILVIGNNVKGINYKLSKCCNPIYGDKIVGLF